MKVNITLYHLFDLPAAARNRAVEDHRHFLLATLQPDFIDGVTDWADPEKMAMYRAEFDYIENNDDPVVESIEANDYWYFYDGTICPACTYVAGPKKGITEITVHGETFTIKEG